MKHETAQKFLLMAQDSALSARDADALARHLRQCTECRAIAREMEEVETQLRYRLKVRYPTVSAAEISLPKARLKAALAPRYPVTRQYAPLMAGIAAVVVLISVLLYASQQFIPQEMEVQQTSTVVAAVVTEVPTIEPTSTEMPLPTSLPTDLPLPTASPQATAQATDEIKIVVTEPLIISPTVIPPAVTAVPSTAVPPTAEPTIAPTVEPPTATTVRPTAMPTQEPTVVVLNEARAVAQLDGYVMALNGASADAVLNFFSEITHYGTGEGRRTQEREELAAEFNALRSLNSYFSLDRCRANLAQHGETLFAISCQLKMTNDWRNALGLSPYVSQLNVNLDSNLAIISLLDYQYRDGIAADWSDVQAFQRWLSTTYPSVHTQQMRGNPVNYLRFANRALLPYADEWVAAGRP